MGSTQHNLLGRQRSNECEGHFDNRYTAPISSREDLSAGGSDAKLAKDCESFGRKRDADQIQHQLERARGELTAIGIGLGNGDVCDYLRERGLS